MTTDFSRNPIAPTQITIHSPTVEPLHRYTTTSKTNHQGGDSPASNLRKRAHDSSLSGSNDQNDGYSKRIRLNDLKPLAFRQLKLDLWASSSPNSAAAQTRKCGDHIAVAPLGTPDWSDASAPIVVTNNDDCRNENQHRHFDNAQIYLNGTLSPAQTVDSSASTPNGGTQPSALLVVKKEADKRTLRSQDGGSRSKSELSLYFPNYEDIISTAPKQAELLTPSTVILITDEHSKADTATKPTFPSATSPLSLPSIPSNGAPPLDRDINAFEIFSFDDIPTLSNAPSHPISDPLSDSFYFKAHRRAERQEKQLRNIEKERAQHEKVQLERLLDGLRGYDWLRVMGISGVTDSEKKTFEGKRDYFVREVEILLEKFRRWKEEEKRRKVGKDVSETADDDDDVEDEDEEEDEDEDEEEDEDEDGMSVDSPPRNLDASALSAHQLQREALLSSSQSHQYHHRTISRPFIHLNLGPPPEESHKPFTSFFSKPYLRKAALGKHRRGRARFAFGLPLPEVEEREFKLPEGFVTKDLVRASRRRGRAFRRDKDGDGE
ncbi:hypothetical protein MMC25_000159 [Agyrium rufum]|nr:hypothetical protein [Agyrium rufum]